MKLTLLELVGDMLISITSEGVTAVTDTRESLTCVNIANRVFEELIYHYPWKHLQTGRGALTAGSNKNELKGPSNTIKIQESIIYYGTTVGTKIAVKYKTPEHFIADQINLDPAATEIEAVNGINIWNDRDPSYFTSFDGVTYVFDAIPTTTGLVAANSYGLWSVGPSARVSTGSATFNLPAQVYPYFSSMCREVAFIELKNEGQVAFAQNTKSWGMFRAALNNFPTLLVDQGSTRDLITARR